jgi:predicted nucleic acid-binding protein
LTPTIVVLDANVLASSAFATHGPLQELILLWESGKIVVLISDHIWREVLTTYSKPY